jgi:predicted molibdopterin-dependent oxidoreductase YjgC
MAGKIRIRILDDTIEIEPGDSILRALQEYGIARGLPRYGFARFCWNHSCKHCYLEFSVDGVRDADFACQTEAVDGTCVHTLPRVLMWKNRLPLKPAPK